MSSHLRNLRAVFIHTSLSLVFHQHPLYLSSPGSISSGLTRSPGYAMLGAGGFRFKQVRVTPVLDLKLMEALRIQGAMRSELTAEAVRELGPADLELLNQDRGMKAVSIQRLRDSHHALAKALARGMTNLEASVHTGYSTVRISVLKKDPAFSELVESYRQQQNLAEANVTERISTLKLDFLEELRNRLEEKPETFSNRETLDCFKELADRSGNGPTRSMNVNQTVVTMQDLLELSKGLHDDAGVTIIESRTVDSGPAVGDAQRLVTLAEGELEGLEGEGDQLSEQGGTASEVDGEVRGTSGGAP